MIHRHTERIATVITDLRFCLRPWRTVCNCPAAGRHAVCSSPAVSGEPSAVMIRESVAGN